MSQSLSDTLNRLPDITAVKPELPEDEDVQDSVWGGDAGFRGTGFRVLGLRVWEC